MNYVGFTAWMSSTVEVDNDELIIFDEVISNIGGYFNPTQSVFICPFSGMYAFYFNVQATTDGPSATLKIVKENVQIGDASADDVDGAYNTGSGFVVTLCEAGEKVWIASNTNNEKINGGNMRTSFSGFLLAVPT